MAVFAVTLSDRTVEHIDGADAYQQEGQMTTFFATRREVIDSWSTRLASFRTSEILSVRRLEEVRRQPTGEMRSTHIGSNASSGRATTTVSSRPSDASRSRISSHCTS